jgi:ABC-type phosphate/phosphonate transport system substrate-binding protein
MFANARRYSVSPAAAQSWRQLLACAARRARVALEWLDYPAPAPLPELWRRAEKGAVFMCGLPFSRAQPRPQLLAAPRPSPLGFDGRAVYWSEFVVASDSPHASLADTFGGRLALTSAESQSGFAAPLRHLSSFGGAHPLYATLLAPQITPQAALAAVAEGRADVAGIDAYSLQLLARHLPQLARRVRSVERTEDRPIPPLVASQPLPALTAQLVQESHRDEEMRPLLSELLLAGFAQPDPEDYAVLARELQATLAYWRGRPLAAEMHAAFQPALAA